MSLVHDVVRAGELAARARECAASVAASSGDTMARGLRAVADPLLAAALRAEQSASADFREGVAAFREKRPPRWPSQG